MFFPRSPLFEEVVDPGGGGGAPPVTPPVFDPAAFKTEILGDFNKTLNGFAKTLKGDVAKEFKTALASFQAPPTGDPLADPPLVPPGDGKPPVIDPTVNAELQKLRRDLDAGQKIIKDRDVALEKERNLRLDTERKSAVDKALDGYEFKTPRAKDVFRKAISPEITRDEDGNLIAETPNGPLPYQDHIKQQLDLSPEFLAANGGGGAGAQPGTRRTGGFNPADISNLDKMSSLTPEQQAQVRAHIAKMATQKPA